MTTIDKSEHIFVKDEGYWLEGHHYGDDVLVVSFEALINPSMPNGYRMGWGASFFRKRRISHLCVKPARSDWYQGIGLARAFTALKAAGFFQRYKRVITYGASMGGLGAIAYSTLIGADAVLAFTPQTTLDTRKLPFDNRFPASRKVSWDGPYSDAADHLAGPKEIVIITDMRLDVDARHINRLHGHNLTIINLPYVGHRIAGEVQEMGLMAPLVMHMIDETFSKKWLINGLRSRRNLPNYYKTMKAHRRVQASTRFQEIVRAHEQKHLVQPSG